MAYFVYMLKCITPKINKTYVGYCKDIKLRLKKHNSGKGARSTRGYEWIVIYKKKYSDRSKAMSNEYKLKINKMKRKDILVKSK